MAEVVFFVLGAVFAFVLSMAVLVAIAGLPQPSGHPVTTPLPKAGGPRPPVERRTAAPSTGAEEQNKTASRRLPPPAPASPPPSSAEREAYRVAVALEKAEVTLFRIARLAEPAAAKIASQTLRRLKQGSESPRARLNFALARLELLSLRPEPGARTLARDVLAAIA